MLDIRPYKPGDEKGFQKLDRLIELHPYNRRNIDNWFWKFQGNNPAGSPMMIYAQNDDTIIGHFAAIPMNYWLNGERIVGSHSAAMMIDPKWQNKGLIKFVADKLIKEIEDRGIPFTYGYPNDNAYDLHIKLLGYEVVAAQRLFIYSMQNNHNELSLTHSNNFKWEKIEKFNQQVDKLWDKTKNNFNAIVIRNSKFLNWRYIDRPDIDYYSFGAYKDGSLEGYCVLKLYQDEKILRGHFIDIYTDSRDRDCGIFLIENGLRFFRENNVNEVTLWMQGSPLFENILKEFRFQVGGVSGGGWPGATRPMICRFNSQIEKYKPYLNEKNWYFTMGDTLEIY